MALAATRCGVLFALPMLLCPAGQAQGKPAPNSVVQVAVHYGPLRDGLLSGVVVNGGAAVLTDAAALKGAQEIAIAFTDSEIFEIPAEKVQLHGSIGLIPLPQRHGWPVVLAPSAANLLELDASAGGAPQSFQAVSAAIHLRRSEGSPQWQVDPALPAHFRGGPLLDRQDRLIGILIQEREDAALVGIPLVVFAGAISPRPSSAPAAAENAGMVAASGPAPVPGEPRFSLPDLRLPLPAPATGWMWADASPPPVPPAPALAPTPIQPVNSGDAAAFVPASSPPAPVSNPVEKAILAAADQIQKKEYINAVTTLEDALKAYPDQPQLHYHLAFAYWCRAALKPDGKLRGNMDPSFYRKTIAEFETFLKQAPADPRAADTRVRLDLLRRAKPGYRPKNE